MEVGFRRGQQVNVVARRVSRLRDVDAQGRGGGSSRLLPGDIGRAKAGIVGGFV